MHLTSHQAVSVAFLRFNPDPEVAETTDTDALQHLKDGCEPCEKLVVLVCRDQLVNPGMSTERLVERATDLRNYRKFDGSTETNKLATT